MPKSLSPIGKIACFALMAAGCSGVSHTADPYVLAGRPYPVEVAISLKSDQTASGTVYYRAGGESDYEQSVLTVLDGGRRLSMSLPTSLSVAGQTIEFYIDLIHGDEQKTLYSPANPMRVRVLGIDQYVAKKLRVDVDFSNDGHPVKFALYPNGLDLSYAVLTYQAPGIPGVITADMSPARKRWYVVVPGEHVHTGWWNYRIDAVVESIEIRIPETGWNTFEVRHVHHDSHADKQQ